MSFRIAIVGSGAIGSYYGAKLAYGAAEFTRAGVQCTVVKNLPLERWRKLVWNAGGRPLEIEPIWGEPLRRATTVGANVPRLEVVYAFLKYLGEAERCEKSAAKIAGHSS
jgi:ketopantoate reductase